MRGIACVQARFGVKKVTKVAVSDQCIPGNHHPMPENRGVARRKERPAAGKFSVEMYARDGVQPLRKPGGVLIRSDTVFSYERE